MRSPPEPTTSPSCGRTSRRCRRHSGCTSVTPVVELDGVSFGYRAGVRVLEDVSLARRCGRVRRHRRAERRRQDDAAPARARARAPAAGTVRVFGTPGGKSAAGARIGYLPQRSRLVGEAPVTVREVVSTGRLAPAGIWGPLRRADREAVTKRDRDGRAHRAGRRTPADALGRDAAAGADRQGARVRADAPRPRRADDRCRRRLAGVARPPPRGSAGSSSASRSSTSPTSSAPSSTSSTGSCSCAAASSTTAPRAGFPACGTTPRTHHA